MVTPYNNATPHKVAFMKRLLAHFRWNGSPHRQFLPVSLLLTLQLFVALKNSLNKKQFQSHAEVETFKKCYLTNLDTDCYTLQKLIRHYDKCLSRLGNFVEKWLQPPTCKYFFLIFVSFLVFFWRGASYFSGKHRMIKTKTLIPSIFVSWSLWWSVVSKFFRHWVNSRSVLSFFWSWSQRILFFSSLITDIWCSCRNCFCSVVCSVNHQKKVQK